MSILSAIAGALTRAASVTIESAAINDFVLEPATSAATVEFGADGIYRSVSQSSGSSDIGPWVTPTTAAGADFEIRASVVTGSVTGSATGSWLALSSTRYWTSARASPGVSAAQITVEIRAAASGAVLDSATFDLTAEVST